MSNYGIDRWVVLVLKIGLGSVFFYAGALKWSEPWVFADALSAYKLIPDVFVSGVALVLPMLEMAAGMLIFVKKGARVAALTMMLLCLVFIYALAWAITHRLQVDCGCFGAGEATAWGTWRALGRGLLLLLAAAWVYLRPRSF